jgi:tetratricopeptide (TPR) repeat protein
MARLLFALLHQRFSGSLAMEQPPPHAGPRCVWLRGGMPVLTDWVVPGEVLGQSLLGQGLVDAGQLQHALEVVAATGGRLGSQLVAMGALDRPRLLEALRQQCTRKLQHLFALQTGEAMIAVGEAAGLEDDLLPVNVLGLVLAGVSVTYDEARVETEIGPALHAPLRATGALTRYRSHFQFRPTDEPALAALDQGTGLASLAGLPGVGLRRAAQLVYTLWACQMLRTGAAAEAATGPDAAAPVVGRARVPTPAPVPARATQAPVASATASASASASSASASASSPGGPTTQEATAASSSSSSSSPASTPAPAAPAAAAAPGHVPRPRRDTPVDIDAPPLAADDAALIFAAELAALEAKLARGAHAFELFGVPIAATKRDVRGAWTELSRKFHPDALQSQGRGHLRERVSKVFAALSEAQQVLGDAEQRDKLRAAIERGEHEPNKDGQDATARAHAAFQSELLAKEGDKLLRVNRFDRALERYREAARYDADDRDLEAAIAWCEYQLSPKAPADLGRIQVVLAKVIEEAPRIARARYFLGFVNVDQGRPAAAIEAFRIANQLDPRLIDAERQARAIELRMPGPSAPPSKRGGLKGLFGGKK